MATNTQVKAQIDLDITNKTTVASISPFNVGANMKAIVDYIDQEVDNVSLLSGPQGPQGVPGPVGPAGLEWRGAWVSGTSYILDDAVGYNGASWFCISPTSGTISPNLDPTKWALLAAQGSPGPQGPQGLPGNTTITTENLFSATNSAPFPTVTAGVTMLVGANASYALPATPSLGEVKYVRVGGTSGITMWASPNPGNDGANNNFITPIGNGNINFSLAINKIYRFTYIGKFGTNFGFWTVEIMNNI
jgi:hypothetical protein